MATSYDVVVRLRTEGSLDASLGSATTRSNALAGALGNTQKMTEKISGSAVDLGKSFNGVFGVAASQISSFASAASSAFTGVVERVGQVALTIGKLGAAAGVGALVYGVGGVNRELENTQISLAAIFGANGVTKNMTEGMSVAATTMAQMRRDAAALPGETKDLVQIFRMASVPGFQAGASVDTLRKLSASAMAVGATMSMPMDQVARETAMLLQGRAGGHNVLGMNLGIKAQGFNELTPEARLARVQKELDKFNPAIDQFSRSFDGAWSTLKDTGKKFLGDAALPLFNRVKETLLGINGVVDANGTKLDAFASKLGNGLVNAFDIGMEQIDRWSGAGAKFADNLRERLGGSFDKLGNVLGILSEKGQNFLESPTSIDKLESALKLYAGLKLAGPLAGAAGGVGHLGSALGQGVTQMGMGLGLDAASAGAIGGPAAIAAVVGALSMLAVVAVSVAGAVHTLTDDTSSFHVMAVRAWDSIRDNAGNALNSMSEAAAALAPAATAVADAMGVTLLLALESVSGAAATAAGFISTVASSFASFGARFGIGGDGTVKTSGGAVEGYVLAEGISDGLARNPNFAPAKSKLGGGGGGGGTHIQKVEIVVNQNDDPSRFARRVVDVLEERVRNPKSSRYAPNFANSPSR